MKAITEPLRELAFYDRMMDALKKRQTPVWIEGCIDIQKCHLISGLGDVYDRKLIITHDEIKAKEICEDYRFFDRNVVYYPPKDILFYNADVHSDLISEQRLSAVRRLMSDGPLTLVTTIGGLTDRIMLPEQVKKYRLDIKPGDQLILDEIKSLLVSMGFERVGQVEMPGQFAVRGGILDVYNMADECPYRLELWGDEVDSIRSFDAQTQRSIDTCEAVTIYPASEYVLTQEMLDRGLHLIRKDGKAQVEIFEKTDNREAAVRMRGILQELQDAADLGKSALNIDAYLLYFMEKTGTLLDYFDAAHSLIVIDDPARTEEAARAQDESWQMSMRQRLQKGYALPGQFDTVRQAELVLDELQDHRVIMLSTLSARLRHLKAQHHFEINARSMHSYRGDFRLLVEDLKKWKRKQYRLILVCSSEVRAKRLSNQLMDDDLMAFYSDNEARVLAPREIMIVRGGLRQGIEYPELHFAILSESDIFGVEKKKKKRRQVDAGREAIRSFSDLSVGDYVVHEYHGIGIYRGLEKVEIDGQLKDYLKIAYADGELLVPVSNLDPLQKYADKQAEKVKLSKLKGKDWTRTKTKVRGAVQELAQDLIRLYAARQSSQGYACEPDTVWQREFEDMFPFEETQDQLTAIEEIKRDMESTRIMDRLLCGDVGFGKTEVAIRAAFKMVQESRQCAVLVPTTVLAQQHYQTFTQRMKDYPVSIGLLSRFRSRADQKRTLDGLKKGTVDIVIGTHRLLSKDVVFKDLGLLVVDEEQRFGVTHKEKIKTIRETVDVLTLTATPIPRTMHMSMIGIRDISLLNEAPVDRLPIQTYVLEYDDEMVREAIVRERARGGQVYYVHNRVQDIAAVCSRISELVPEAEVAFAHGQMSERELEDIMFRFTQGEIDVLVSTTIIETGLDIPNANTLIIQNAERFGLSQLYQLRGRVGRSSRTAYAFLMYDRNKMLKEVAEKRLEAIREFTALGSGYRIAMRDLEIRGAGSLLGRSQSGHMAAVGYDLYCKLLGEAVQEAKGITVQESFETRIDIGIDAYLPETYIRNENQRLDCYKRIASIKNEEDYGDLLDELIDRYGELPKPVSNLLMIAYIKALAHEAWVVRLVHRDRTTKIYLHERAMIDANMIVPFTKFYGNRMRFNAAAENPYFTVDMKGVPSRNLLTEEKELMQQMLRMLCHREV